MKDKNNLKKLFEKIKGTSFSKDYPKRKPKLWKGQRIYFNFGDWNTGDSAWFYMSEGKIAIDFDIFVYGGGSDFLGISAEIAKRKKKEKIKKILKRRLGLHTLPCLQEKKNTVIKTVCSWINEEEKKHGQFIAR